MGEFKQIQEILSKIGTEFFKIDEEMTEKNESEDGNSISLKSPWHHEMRQTAIPPIFYMLPDESKMPIMFSSVPKGNLRPVCRVRKKGFEPL